VVTAGLTGAVAALPEQVATQQRDVALTKTTIPITDVDETFGPVHVVQKQELSFDADTPGQLTLANIANNSATLTGKQLQAGLGTSSSQVLTLFGAAQGYGATLSGASSSGSGSFSFPGVGKGFVKFSVGQYSATVKAQPSGGVTAKLFFSPIAGGADGNIALGDYSLSGGGSGGLSSTAYLCLGSTDSCEGAIAVGQVVASGSGKFTLTTPGGSKPVSFVSPTAVSAILTPGELLVTGDVGGTVTIGTRTVGRVRGIDIHIPTTSAVTLAGANRQSQSLGNAQQPSPGEKVKTAVRAAKHRAQGRHAAD
jgi:hypothetical protein